ncbi:LysM peptidoglycan-binding domain-containing protein [Aedoeadaptatus coli]|uniref:LysM peptidoglycan-binding domain-containing protein n=1 Tax=Aedoeadaptatus coli TaxID=2058292 RepID=UPI000D552CF1|nr:LysM domain-containing protein [Peptoniphilus coli]
MKREKAMNRPCQINKRSSARAVKYRKRLRLLPIILLLLMSIMGTTVPKSVGSYQVREAYCVKPGDTLWSIASSYADESDDLRLMIHRMVEANDLKDNCTLRPGETIYVVLEERDLRSN